MEMGQQWKNLKCTLNILAFKQVLNRGNKFAEIADSAFHEKKLIGMPILIFECFGRERTGKGG